jgi:hypothetical protein
MMCPPCHPAGGDEHKSQWGVGNTTLVLSLLTFIHAAVISVPKLLRKACRIGLNWYWNVPDKEPLEERMGNLENDFVTLKERTSADVEGVEKHIQSDRSRIKRLEDSHSGLKEDKKALHKRVTTLKETLEHEAKVEVGEGASGRGFEGGSPNWHGRHGTRGFRPRLCQRQSYHSTPATSSSFPLPYMPSPTMSIVGQCTRITRSLSLPNRPLTSASV